VGALEAGELRTCRAHWAISSAAASRMTPEIEHQLLEVYANMAAYLDTTDLVLYVDLTREEVHGLSRTETLESFGAFLGEKGGSSEFLKRLAHPATEREAAQ
jgi:hypothetical protein